MSDTSSPEANAVKLTPGSVVQHRDGAVVVLAQRKADDSGWWLTDHGGLADSVLGHWRVLHVAPMVTEDDAGECEACGVANDVDGCTYHRGWDDGYVAACRHFTAVMQAATEQAERFGASGGGTTPA